MHKTSEEPLAEQKKMPDRFSTPRRRFSTAMLILAFIGVLAFYGWLHGSTRFSLFHDDVATPTVSTVEPLPVIQWDQYQEKIRQEKREEEETTEPAETTDPDSPIGRLPVREKMKDTGSGTNTGTENTPAVEGDAP